jgi:hypothetical protein
MQHKALYVTRKECLSLMKTQGSLCGPLFNTWLPKTTQKPGALVPAAAAVGAPVTLPQATSPSIKQAEMGAVVAAAVAQENQGPLASQVEHPSRSRSTTS